MQGQLICRQADRQGGSFIKNVTRVNDKIVNNSTDPLYCNGPLTTVIKRFSFTSSQTNTLLWQPATGKSIYLTALACATTSALTTITVNFSRASNAVFLVCRVINSSPYEQSFFVPVVFNPNETIRLSSTLLLTTLNISLFGYEQ